MRKIQKSHNSDTGSKCGLGVIDMVPDVDYAGNGSEVNHQFSAMAMGT